MKEAEKIKAMRHSGTFTIDFERKREINYVIWFR